MHVTMKAPTMSMKIVLRSPKARHLSPRPNPHYVAACHAAQFERVAATNGAPGYIVLGSFVWMRGGVEWFPRMYCPWGFWQDARRR